jgi:hypothetical protein
MKNENKDIEEEEIYQGMEPPKAESFYDLELISEENGMTLLKSKLKGRVFAVSRITTFSGDDFRLVELTT